MAARILPAWRSLLFVPVTAERFVAKAHERGADVIILDLEDSISPDNKVAAREALVGAVPRVGQGGAPVCVRINRPLDLAVPDIRAAVAAKAEVLMLPKLMGPEHVRLLSELVADEEARNGLPVGGIRFIGAVETAEAMPQLQAIAAADSRMVAFGLGVEDLATDMEAESSADSLYVPMMQGLLAARGAGVLPMGVVGAFAGFNDLEGYRAAVSRSRKLGFTCAACIHPSQVPVLNEEYGPSPAETERARRLVEVYEAALSEGRGAASFEGAMIDVPIVDRARRILARASAVKGTEASEAEHPPVRIQVGDKPFHDGCSKKY